MDLSQIPGDARVYLRPVDFVDAPQLAGRKSARLTGGMIWFAGVEAWFRGEGELRPRRYHIALDDWDEALDRLPPALADHANLLFDRLTAPRPAIALGERTLRFDAPRVMGIVNRTPDSFSDGGLHEDIYAAAEAARAMGTAGADIIDIGGESTRPGAPLVWEGDELERVRPLIEQLAGGGMALSIDTRKASVMEGAIAAGAHMVNDISGLAYDERALETVAALHVPVCIMHASSQSSNPHEHPVYQDVITEVFDWLEGRIVALEAAGIDRARIIVDPGLGFGKSLGDNLAILNNLTLYHGLGCPLLVGASRKRMIGALSGEAPADRRLGGSIELGGIAMAAGAHILRVHDVAEMVQAAHVWRGLRDAALSQLPAG